MEWIGGLLRGDGMTFWHTDNAISQAVKRAMESGGIECRHVRIFNPYMHDDDDAVYIFYGLLRGTGSIMRYLQFRRAPFIYLDNGYFDALYVDRSGMKDVSGSYRIVKSGMHEKYAGPSYPLIPNKVMRDCLLIPPSPYSAYFHDTTPEDWIHEIVEAYPMLKFHLRTKASDIELEAEINRHDCVLAFNSMAIMKAIEIGRPVADTHGCLQNKEFRNYKLEDMRAFYEPKQCTLEQIAKGEIDWQQH